MPDTLFSQGVVGAWYDPSDTGSLFQDVAGTQPVTAAGQTVALIRDKSGNGIHLRQSTLEQRPAYGTDGARHWLAFDGVDDFLSIAALDMSTTDKVTILTGLRAVSNAIAIYLEFSTNSNTSTGSFWSARAGADTFDAFARGGAAVKTTQVAHSAAVFLPPSDNVVTNLHDVSGDRSQVRVDGFDSGPPATGDKGSGTFGNHPLFMGMRAGSSLPFQGRIYGMILLGALATSTELSEVEAYLAAKTGTSP